MKILMYSDLHISRTSSIMPMLEDSKYTYRQKMILETGKYLADLADNQKPDMIINLGDTFDQHTLTSYDVNVASEFFKCFRYLSIPHLVLVGNHEMINNSFNAVEILNNIDNITVIDEPSSSNLMLNTKHEILNAKLAFIPYRSSNDVLEFPDGDILFSHLDIQGSSVRGDFTLPTGVEQKTLTDKYQFVFNGHIHKPSVMNKIINVGSISTHSFSDDEESVPQCYIFDTDTLDLQVFKPKICPLFRKLDIDSVEELQIGVNKLKQQWEGYKLILHVVCPFEVKEDVKQILNDDEMIINSRINVKVIKSEEVKEEEIVNLQSNIDIEDTFTKFLDTVDLKVPKGLYINVLKEVK